VDVFKDSFQVLAANAVADLLFADATTNLQSTPPQACS
jgi:hypothetical protein